MNPRTAISAGLLAIAVGVGVTSLQWTSPVTRNVAAQAEISGNRPRLILTASKKAGLLAKKNANHPDFAALKSYVDGAMPPWITNVTALASSAGTSARTLTVTDGGRLPGSAFLVRIGTELIGCASRTGNTLNDCTRGATPTDFGLPTVAMAHDAGTPVWEHRPGADYVNLTPMAALLVQLDTAGYEVKARGLLSTLAMYTMAGNLYQNGNYVRWFVPGFALAYDWNYANLTDHERTTYTEAMRLIARDHLTPQFCGGCAKETYAVEVNKRDTAIQTSLYGNVANGELQAVMMAAAASHGNNPAAGSQWSHGMRKVQDWLLPAIVDGVAADGISPEGSEYSAESYLQTLNIFNVIESATGNTAHKPALEAYAAAVGKFLIYSTLPGTVKSAESTTGTIARGSSALTVDSPADFHKGQPIRVGLDVAPWVMETAIVAVAGNTFTLRDVAIGPATKKPVTHIHRELAWGDATENAAFVYADSIVSDGHIAAGYKIVDLLKHANPEMAGYMRHWLDRVVNDAGVALWGKFLRFIYDDSSVPARDYREALPTLWGSSHAKSTGMLIGRSDWSATATLVHFLVGGEMYDHTHSHFNSYQIRRGGTWLSRELPGYGVSPFPGVFQPLIGEGKYLGARYHNTVLMNGHGGNNGHIMATELTTPATMTRSELSESMMYARGDASGQYSSPHWGAAKYTSNDARTFIRDFIYLKPDLIVFADTLRYAAASVSPTTWIARFAGNPDITGQRFTSEYGGQKIVQDVVVPAKARFTKINEITENPDLDDYHTQPHFRIETTSGATAADERSLQVIQLMDGGGHPQSVTAVSTEHADVVQVGEYVVGAVHGERPTLPISYAYTGKPKHYLMGFEPNTAYDVVDTGSRITIRQSGAGTVVSTRAGLLFIGVAATPRAVKSTLPAPSALRVMK